MKIFKIEIENYRLLKNFTIDLEDSLSLVIGKNNTGKTSILSILNKFLNLPHKDRFSFNDFNLEYSEQLQSIIDSDYEILFEDYQLSGINLRLFIEYNEEDNLSNISKVMMSLDPQNNVVVLGFGYKLEYEDYIKIRKEYRLFKLIEKQKKNLNEGKQETELKLEIDMNQDIPIDHEKQASFQNKSNQGYTIRDIYYFFQQNHSAYFTFEIKSIDYNISTKEINRSKTIDLEKEKISVKEIINFKSISANRDVTNKEIDKTLSGHTSSIYSRTESNDDQNMAVEDFKDRLSLTDDHLNVIYTKMFDNVINKVKTFGGIRPNESEIEIISNLQHRELLKENTTVVYKHGNTKLPEHYNGLGYMNLISMIFQIEILLHDFRRSKEEKPSDVNILFIEEPEAHTHPQMQYIFIKNIKNLIAEGIRREDGEDRNLQYIITTHSSCIVTDSDFDDIKYLRKVNENQVISKNIRDLKKEYIDEEGNKSYRFLKQYLTLNCAELFFADKAIFIEGDTERLLIPAMMKKIDNEYPGNPIRSQNVSILVVGAHSHVFEKFIDFIGIDKTLIISDIDSYCLVPKFEDDGITQKTNPTNGILVYSEKKCPVSDSNASHTSNASLRFFHNNIDNLIYYKDLSFNWKILRKNKHRKWVSNKKGKLLLVYQTIEKSYHARSFEDAFIETNKEFIIDTNNTFPSLKPKYLKQYSSGMISTFEFSNKAIESKPSFAIEVLLNSKTDCEGIEFSNWEIPSYIKEGLLWLKQD